MKRDGGYVALEFVLGVGLILVPVAVLVLSLPTWVERVSLGRVAAREAARVAVTADDLADGFGQATRTVDQVAANHGVPAEDVELCLSVHHAGSPPPRTCSGPRPVTRADAVSAHVAVRLPALTLPGLPMAVPAGTRTWVHTERIDRFRSW